MARQPVAGPSPAQRAAGTGLSQVRRSAIMEPSRDILQLDPIPHHTPLTSPVDPRCVLLLFTTLTVALDQLDCSCYAARHHPE